MTDADHAYNDRATQFMNVLHKLRDLRWTMKDYYWLVQRKRSRLSLSERNWFLDAPCIMDFRKDTEKNPEHNCNYHNRMKLRRHAKEKEVPVVQFLATHEGIDEPTAGLIDESFFNGLATSLELAEDARVLLIHNLMPEQGLMNGTQGTVKLFIYDSRAGPTSPDVKARMPRHIVVDFPQYVGPPFYKDDPARRTWVPLEPKEVAKQDNATIKRRQYPLILAWALTPWKAQGMTLDKAVLFIGRRADSPGVLFVALSRVRHPDDLMLDDDFPDMATIMSQKQKLSFRHHQIWENMMNVKFSQTLRREMRDNTIYDPSMTWTQELSNAADVILRDMRTRLKTDGNICVDEDRHVELNIPRDIYDSTWDRLRRHPHTCEVDHAAGRLDVCDTNVDYEMLRQTLFVHPTFAFKQWRVKRSEWHEFVNTGCLSLAMFEHFSLYVRESLSPEVFLAKPWNLQQYMKDGDMQRLERGKAKPATTLIFPYRTTRSHFWMLFVVTMNPTTRQLNVFIPSAANWKNDDPCKTATDRLREAYDFGPIVKNTVTHTKSEEVLYLATVVEINEKVHGHRTPIQRPTTNNRMMLLANALEYATYVDKMMQDSETNDIDFELKRDQHGQQILMEIRSSLHGRPRVNWHHPPDHEPVAHATRAHVSRDRPKAWPMVTADKPETTFKKHKVFGSPQHHSKVAATATHDTIPRQYDNNELPPSSTMTDNILCDPVNITGDDLPFPSPQKRKHKELDVKSTKVKKLESPLPDIRNERSKMAAFRSNAEQWHGETHTTLKDNVSDANRARETQRRQGGDKLWAATKAEVLRSPVQLKRQRTSVATERTLQKTGVDPRWDELWGERYFERQQRAECGRHALNNVLGVAVFTHDDMQTAAEQVIAETNTQHERSQHIDRNTGWYSHSVIARVPQNVREVELCLTERPATPTDYRFMLTTAAIRGAIINEHGAHWSAIVKHNEYLWHVDSRSPHPILLAAAGFADLIDKHPGRVIYVQAA